MLYVHILFSMKGYCFYLSVYPYNRRGETEQNHLKEKQARNLEASTSTCLLPTIASFLDQIVYFISMGFSKCRITSTTQEYSSTPRRTPTSLLNSRNGRNIPFRVRKPTCAVVSQRCWTP